MKRNGRERPSLMRDVNPNIQKAQRSSGGTARRVTHSISLLCIKEKDTQHTAHRFHGTMVTIQTPDSSAEVMAAETAEQPPYRAGGRGRAWNSLPSRNVLQRGRLKEDFPKHPQSERCGPSTPALQEALKGSFGLKERLSDGGADVRGGRSRHMHSQTMRLLTARSRV